jgi:hypothetical protein
MMCRDIKDCAPGFYCDDVKVKENTETVYKSICTASKLDGEKCDSDD